MKDSFRIAVDTGGTFTDICIINEAGGEISVAKVPSTPDNPALAVIEGINEILKTKTASPEDVSFLIHGTTVATNALLEGKGARTALLTTKGFEDVIIIGRQSRPKLCDNRAQRPAPLVSRKNCYGVDERMLHTGNVLKPINPEQVTEIINQIRQNGISSIAVTLLHSYANSIHEKRIGAIINQIYPEAYVTLSCEVLPEFREYERTSTICINAFVMPKVNDYVAYLDTQIKQLGIASDLYIMQSNGGVITADTAKKVSARTVLSGPAGGALTGALLSNATGVKNVITVDVGGTSSDICLIENGQPDISTESEIEGYPIKLAMIDINTIGAGGGSIAWIDSGGALQVGPESAGASPGPVFYGRGGTEPTVTDANAVLGRINPAYLLDGAMEVFLEDAWGVIEEKISKPLGISVMEAAEGIIEVVNANMLRGIRRVSVEKGYDPREFALIPFGGAGPMHGADLASALNINQVIIPAHPGIGSAFGMLSADVRHDYVRTHIINLDVADIYKLEEYFKEMETQAVAQLKKEGFEGETVELLRQADLRYFNQAYEINIALPERTFDTATASSLKVRFHQSHKRSYGYARADEPLELVNLRLVAIGKLPGFSFEKKNVDMGKDAIPTETRRVYFQSKAIETPVYLRKFLSPNQRIEGPAIIDQLDSTIVVTPEFTAESDSFGNLILKAKDKKDGEI